jgi:hypothetical protein
MRQGMRITHAEGGHARARTSLAQLLHLLLLLLCTSTWPDGVCCLLPGVYMEMTIVCLLLLLALARPYVIIASNCTQDDEQQPTCCCSCCSC